MPTRSINERLQRLARELGLAQSEVHFTVGPTTGPFLFVVLKVADVSATAQCSDASEVHKWFDILLGEVEAGVGIYEPATLESVGLIHDLAIAWHAGNSGVPQ